MSHEKSLKIGVEHHNWDWLAKRILGIRATARTGAAAAWVAHFQTNLNLTLKQQSARILETFSKSGLLSKTDSFREKCLVMNILYKNVLDPSKQLP